MSSRTKIALCVAIALATVFPASAATKDHRVAHIRPASRSVMPDYNGGCPPSGGPSCSERCLPSGPPCRTRRDEAYLSNDDSASSQKAFAMDRRWAPKDQGPSLLIDA
jgi:hypothetical protein